TYNRGNLIAILRRIEQGKSALPPNGMWAVYNHQDELCHYNPWHQAGLVCVAWFTHTRFNSKVIFPPEMNSQMQDMLSALEKRPKMKRIKLDCFWLPHRNSTLPKAAIRFYTLVCDRRLFLDERRQCAETIKRC